MNAVQKTRVAAWLAFIVFAGAVRSFAYCVPRAGVGPSTRDRQTDPGEPSTAEVLKQIYGEVKELGPYPGETVIRHDFFLGPADDDSYKKEHIVVLINAVDGAERMKIQVTEMKTRPDNPRIQLAGKTWTISCSISAKGALRVLRSDYSDKETARLAPMILRAIREKKKLLQQYGGARLL